MFHHDSDTPFLPTPYYAPAAAPSNNSFFDGSGGGGTGSYNPLYLSPPASSQSPPYSSSLPSCHLLRTSSTLSLHSHSHITEATPQPPLLSSSPSSSPREFLDFYSEPVRRVFSTGDLQGMNGMQASGENSSQEGTVVAGRVGRYSAEERKERIERYRSKRNHRNFQKKITYACRKTLADSRPRVRGRFARNGETEAEAEGAAEVSYDGYNYNAYEPSYNSSHQSYNAHEQSQNDGGNSEWWRPMQEALAKEEEDKWCFDEDGLAYHLGMFSMDLLY